MMSVTHAIIGVCGTTLLLQTADPVVLGLAIIGSQIPDLDSSHSLVGQVFFSCLPLARRPLPPPYRHPLPLV